MDEKNCLIQTHTEGSSLGGNCVINFCCLARPISQISQHFVLDLLQWHSIVFSNSFDVRVEVLVWRGRVLCHPYGGCDARSFNLWACLKARWAEMFGVTWRGSEWPGFAFFLPYALWKQWVFPEMSWRGNPSPSDSDLCSWNQLCLARGRIQA